MKTRLRGRMARWIRKRQGPDSLPLTLSRKRLYILPTRAGVGFGLLLALMLVAGLNYANSTALFLTFLLTGFALVAMHQCHRNLLGAQLVAATAQPTFAHRSGTLSLIFENAAAAARLRIAAGVGDEPVAPTDLPARGRGKVELSVAAAKRGLVQIDRLHLITTHPFGLFRTWTWVHAPIEMLVYPRPNGSLPMPTHYGNKAGARSVTNTGSDEWLGLRPFRDGDSPRQVDWKAYAREAPLLVKEYSAAGAELRMFDFGALGNLQLETKLEQLARWVVDAEGGGERYGLRLPDNHIEPDRGPEHRHRCLAALAMFGLEDARRGEDKAT
ncbi:MAG TPA: DUF58 domain-containing protein [Steroidobacteraceae bacterium]|jgi:uncharacterized protein (DUF58 family)|nr:DUF58 domain-containing protein [Steroidobacteraceae bacterium]